MDRRTIEPRGPLPVLLWPGDAMRGLAVGFLLGLVFWGGFVLWLMSREVCIYSLWNVLG